MEDTGGHVPYLISTSSPLQENQEKALGTRMIHWDDLVTERPSPYHPFGLRVFLSIFFLSPEKND